MRYLPVNSRLSTAGLIGSSGAAWRRRYGPGCHDAEDMICKKIASECRVPPALHVLGPDRHEGRPPMTAEHELVLTRLIDAPREKLFRCWTEPALIKQWFAPEPYTTPVAEVDLRVGGASNIVMQSPD